MQPLEKKTASAPGLTPDLTNIKQGEFLSLPANFNPKKSDLELAREIISFLEKKFNENFTIAQLSMRFNMNRFKLTYCFKIVANENIHEFISRLRVENSKRYLEDLEMPIKQIAKRMGLDKTNYNRQFKKHTGLTPTEWRRDLNARNES